MNNKERITTKARHCYTQAYADYLRSGNLENATRQVAHEIYTSRNGATGNPDADWQEAQRITREWPNTITETSHAHAFDKALSKTSEWLKEVETELEFKNPNDAYRALRAVLHAMRDRLPVNEAVELASQLPVLIMGMYYSGWTPKNKPMKMRTLDEFLDHVSTDLPKGMDPLRITQGIIKVLESHVSRGEMKDVRNNFPEAIREIWGETVKTGNTR
ncbi:MAG TPA: DUF2267 domain-containing protein [Elusimicrobiales bacterium]|nr:DUF2267 domain-containing protein [Elusimicrobiales bacterium]